MKNVWIVKKVVNGRNVVVATCETEKDAYDVVEKLQNAMTTFKVCEELN